MTSVKQLRGWPLNRLSTHGRRNRHDRSLYLDELAARGGEKIPFGNAMKLVGQHLTQALAFWTITFRPAKDMPDMQPNAISLCFIERIAVALDDLDALGSY